MDALDRMVMKKSKNKFDRVNVIVMMPPNGGPVQPIQSMYTGAGPDGVVQPDRAAAMDYASNPPKVLHEDEVVNQLPNGNRTVIPSKMTLQGMQMAQTPQQQQQMGQMQKMGLQGFQTGTDPYGYDTNQSPGLPNQDNNASANLATYTSPPPPSVPPMSPPPVDQSKPLADQSRRSIYTQAQDKNLGIMTGIAQGTDPYSKTVANRATDTYNANAGYTNMAAQSKMALNPNLTEGAKNVMQADLARQANIGMSQLQGTLAENQQARMHGAAQSAFTMGGQMNQQEMQQEQNAWNQSLEMNDYASAAGAYKKLTGNDLDTTAYQEFLRQKTETGKGNLTIQGQTIIANDLANEATRVKALDTASQKKWEDFLRAAEYGDKATVESAYEAYFGRQITDDAMVNDLRDYARGTRAASLEAGITANLASKFGLQNAQMQSVIDLINKGVDDAGIIAQFPNMNLGSLDSIRKTYDLETKSREISNLANQYGLDSAKMKDVVGLINSGAKLDLINSQYPDINMTEDQYNGIKENYTLLLGKNTFDTVSSAIQNGATFGAVKGLMNNAGIDDGVARETFYGIQQKLYNLPMKSMLQDVGAKDWEMLVSQASLGQGALQKSGEHIGQYGYDLNNDGTLDKFISETQQVGLNEWSPARLAQKNWDKQFGLTEIQVQSNMYWDGSEKFSDQVTQNVALQDALNATRKPDGTVDYKAAWQVIASTPGAKDNALAWFKAKYGRDAAVDPNDKTKITEPGFEEWAAGEFVAAADSRLTNPFDATIHTIQSSKTLKPEEKSALVSWFKAVSLDPNAEPMDFVYNKDGERTGVQSAKLSNINTSSDLITTVLNMPKQSLTIDMIDKKQTPQQTKDINTTTELIAENNKTVPSGHYKISYVNFDTGINGIKIDGAYLLGDDGSTYFIRTPQNAITRSSSTEKNTRQY